MSTRGSCRGVTAARLACARARFYGLPLNQGTVTLERSGQEVPEKFGDLVPFHAGETLRWRLAG